MVFRSLSASDTGHQPSQEERPSRICTAGSSRLRQSSLALPGNLPLRFEKSICHGTDTYPLSTTTESRYQNFSNKVADYPLSWLVPTTKFDPGPPPPHHANTGALVRGLLVH
ncbi:hypothetical protein Bbelb_405230 [Branchiostoma belcheri]|nr:hypothetical protein Bbelb_405230 [Branchiostoma belcheri]